MKKINKIPTLSDFDELTQSAILKIVENALDEFVIEMNCNGDFVGFKSISLGNSDELIAKILTKLKDDSI